MRPVVFVGVLFVSLAMPAAANADRETPPLKDCEKLVEDIPDNPKDDRPLYAAAVSVATCVADNRLALLGELPDDLRSAVAIAEAAAPSLQLLDEVSKIADPEHRLRAHHARGNLWLAMAARMRKAVAPAPKPGTTQRRADVERVIAPWLEQAASDFAEVREIAQSGQLTTTPAITRVVRDSAKSLRTLRANRSAIATGDSGTDVMRL